MAGKVISVNESNFEQEVLNSDCACIGRLLGSMVWSM
jgi:hypothetical protein